MARWSIRDLKRNAVRVSKPRFTVTEMNKTEAEFQLIYLTPAVARKDLGHVEYQKIKFWVGLGSFYTPDFTAINLSDNRLQVYEVKGPHTHEDSLIKFKACAGRYTWADWWWYVRGSDGHWRVTNASTIARG